MQHWYTKETNEATPQDKTSLRNESLSSECALENRRVACDCRAVDELILVVKAELISVKTKTTNKGAITELMSLHNVGMCDLEVHRRLHLSLQGSSDLHDLRSEFLFQAVVGSKKFLTYTHKSSRRALGHEVMTR